MAESMDKSLRASSDILPELYCETCHDVEGKFLQAMGFCRNCAEYLCIDCVAAHKKAKLSRNHKLDSESNMPKKKPQIKLQDSGTEKCHIHQGEIIGSICRSCDQLCCKICLVVNHQGCTVDNISNISANITSSQEFKDLNKKISLLQKGYNKNVQEAGKHITNVEKNFKDAIQDIKKLKLEFDKLLAETERQAANTKEEDLKKFNTVSTTSSILLEEINKIATNLEIVEAKKDKDNLFIMIKRAESQMQSLEESLVKLETDNNIRNYQFEPDKKLVALLKDLKVLGQLTVPKATVPKATIPKATVPKATVPKATMSVQMLKSPIHLKDIDIVTTNIRGSVMLTNQQLLVTDYHGKVKLLDTKSSKIVSELHLLEKLGDMTKVKSTEVAITFPTAKKIQFVSISSNTLSKARKMSVNGVCLGIAYNDHDQTLVVTFENAPKVEILNMAGSVIKSFDKDASGSKLFSEPRYTALSPDQTLMYISDRTQHSVTIMTMQGEVKAVYKDDKLKEPYGICVNRSGIVYLAACGSHTVHQILPRSDKLELLLDQKDGLAKPFTITYCDDEDKLYVGQNHSNMLKVFQMK